MCDQRRAKKDISLSAQSDQRNVETDEFEQTYRPIFMFK